MTSPESPTTRVNVGIRCPDFISGKNGRCVLCNYPLEFPSHWNDSGVYNGPWPIADEDEVS